MPSTGPIREPLEKSRAPLGILAQVEREDLAVHSFCLFSRSPDRYFGTPDLACSKLPGLATLHHHYIHEFFRPSVDLIGKLPKDTGACMRREPFSLKKTATCGGNRLLQFCFPCLADAGIHLSGIGEPDFCYLFSLPCNSSNQYRVRFHLQSLQFKHHSLPHVQPRDAPRLLVHGVLVHVSIVPHQDQSIKNCRCGHDNYFV